VPDRWHNLCALDYAQYAFVLENGRVVDEGSAAELAAREDIQNYYLGAVGQGTVEY
jgi:branched-chain amino acid transport system ATP-binding protein